MYHDGVYLPITVLSITFDRTFSSDIDHSSITLDHPIVDGFEVSYEVTDVVDHAGIGIIFHSN